jgi:hypothetical protein
MENIAEYQQRTMERSRKLTSTKELQSPAVVANEAKKQPQQQQPQPQNKLKTPLSSRIFHTFSKNKTPLRESTTTPKMNKAHSSATIVSSHIPRLNLNVNKKPTEVATNVEPSVDQPKTPLANKVNQSNQIKTPSTARKMIHSTFNSLKKKFGINSNFPLSNTGSSMIPTNDHQMPSSSGPSNLLMSSSFNRRKSYDLSMRQQHLDMQSNIGKQQSYQAHTGKIKPIDFNSKPLFLSSVNLNLTNEVKSPSTGVMDPTKRKLSMYKSTGTMVSSKSIDTGFHPDVKSQSKSKTMLKVTQEATAHNKKLQHENAKMKKDADLNKKRQIVFTPENGDGNVKENLI